MVCQLVINSFSFYMSVKAFIPTIFLKVVFTIYRIQSYHSFFFQFFNDVAPFSFSLLSMVKHCHHSYLCSSVYISIFPCGQFYDFVLIIGFKQFDYDISMCRFSLSYLTLTNYSFFTKFG